MAETYVDRIMREGRERREQYAAEQRAEWEASGAGIPDLVFDTPLCSVCGEPTEYDDGFRCDGCRIQWPRNGYGHEAERWTDE